MRIYLSPPDLHPKTISYVSNVLTEGWIAPNGPENAKLESLIASHHQLKSENVLSCSSGTAALHLIYKSVGISTGDVVFCPTLTFVATVNPILQEGAMPWFVDSEPETGGMSPELLRNAIKKCIKENKKPKAVVLVHLLGYPAKAQEIRTICDEFNLFLIDDSAEALGSLDATNQHVFRLADVTALSFNGNKILTTSGGGAVVSKDAKIIEKARFYSNNAKVPALGYWHSEQGFNYALSNISAAIGVAEWKTLYEKLAKKKQIQEAYLSVFNQLDLDIKPFPNQAETKPNFWLSAFFMETERRDTLHLSLLKAQIESRLLWTPLHIMPFLSSFPQTLDGTAVKMANSGLCLPSGTGLKINEQEEICSLVEKVLKS